MLNPEYYNETITQSKSHDQQYQKNLTDQDE